MDSVNTSRVLLPVGVRVASTPSLKQQDGFAKFIRLYLNVTAASGSGGLKPVFRGYDRVSGSPVELTPGSASITTAGVYVWEISSSSVPSAAFGSVKEVTCRSIPFQWDVLVKHLDGSTYNYSVSADVTK